VRAVDGSDRCGGTDGLLVLIYFRVPEWWMRVRRPRTKVVAVAATTAATRRWTGGARGRGVGSVWGNGRHGVVLVFFRGPEWWMRVHCPCTKVVAVAATTTATRRWTGGVHGRGVGLVWGNGRHGVVLVFFRGPEWWRRICCPHTEVVASTARTAHHS
jgi:hypothetical protein